jgi:hypothetical protein
MQVNMGGSRRVRQRAGQAMPTQPEDGCSSSLSLAHKNRTLGERTRREAPWGAEPRIGMHVDIVYCLFCMHSRTSSALLIRSSVCALLATCSAFTPWLSLYTSASNLCVPRAFELCLPLHL